MTGTHLGEGTEGKAVNTTLRSFTERKSVVEGESGEGREEKEKTHGPKMTLSVRRHHGKAEGSRGLGMWEKGLSAEEKGKSRGKGQGRTRRNRPRFVITE